MFGWIRYYSFALNSTVRRRIHMVSLLNLESDSEVILQAWYSVLKKKNHNQ